MILRRSSKPEMDPELDRMIHKVAFEGFSLDHVEYDADEDCWAAAITLVDPHGQEANFALVIWRTIEDEFPHGDFLTVSWVVVPIEEVVTEDATALLETVNRLNGERGAKFWVREFADGERTVCCEVDLPMAQLTQDLLDRAVQRTMDLVYLTSRELAEVAAGKSTSSTVEPANTVSESGE